MPLTIEKDLCPQNHRCPLIDLCPVQAITQEGYGLPHIDTEICISCGTCISACGMGAVCETH